MTKKNNFKSWSVVFILIALFSGVWWGVFSNPNYSGISINELKVNKSYVLVHEFKGVITDSKKWIEKVDKFAKKSSIKAVVIIINSPGGVVGPSQELYHFLKKIRTEYNKPVVVYSSTVLASGAYYMALGADEIITSPGAMVGSIGVIMEFLNLEGVYEWAKIKRFSVTSGKFKDSGAEYRAMRDDEKALFQTLINDVYDQFVTTIKDELKLDSKVMEAYADGRVMTGRQAKEAGLIHSIGYLDDAIAASARIAQIKDPEPFYIPKEDPGLLERLIKGEESEEASLKLVKLGMVILRAELAGLPLYLMPDYWGE
jgi:protease-4